MTQDELKQIWQDDGGVPTINFGALRETLDVWQRNLRRKIWIDIAMQVVLVFVVLAIVWFYPKLFFMFWVAVVLAAGYILELVRLYRREKTSGTDRSVREFFSRRRSAFESFLHRSRTVLYLLPIVLVPAAYYFAGVAGSLTELFSREWFVPLLVPIVICEVASVLLCELYFKIFYGASRHDLDALLRELDSEL